MISDVGMDAILRGIKLDEKPATIIAMDLETTGLSKVQWILIQVQIRHTLCIIIIIFLLQGHLDRKIIYHC